MDAIRTAYEDKTDYYSELKIKIKNNFVYSIKFYNIKYKCKKCCEITELKTHHDEQCNNCYEFFDLVTDIEYIIFDFDFPEYTKKEIKAGDDGELIKFNFMNYYILILCFASYEPNSCSSTPHNNYVIKCCVFDNAEKRDECYDKYNDNDNIIHDNYFEHDISNNF